MKRTADRKTKINIITPGRDTISRVIAMGLFPAFFYLAVFAAVTWPLLREFSTSLFADERDGLVISKGDDV